MNKKIEQYLGWIVGGILSAVFIGVILMLANLENSQVVSLIFIVVGVELALYIIGATLYHSIHDKHRNIVVSILTTVMNFMVILAIVIVIRSFLFTPFRVDGQSMEASLHDQEMIFVDKISYKLHEPERGDVIVFVPPIDIGNKSTITGLQCTLRSIVLPLFGGDPENSCRILSIYVKRVIGVPGDVIRIQDGRVYITPHDEHEEYEVIDDFLMTENQHNTCYLNGCDSVQDRSGRTYEVADDSVFVLGDNRTHSTDSRRFTFGQQASPYVPYDNIKGKVQTVLWPPTQWRSIVSEELYNK